jgi:BNR repeat protein
VLVRAKGLALLALATAAALVLVVTASANVSLTPIEADGFTNSTSQHKTAVEPDSFSYGGTMVVASQLGRFNTGGGASGIGWARLSGTTWTSGVLPGITKPQDSSNAYDRDTDPSVAYDAKDGVWLIASLPLTVSNNNSVKGAAVVVSRSTNGGSTWGNPRNVATASGSHDFDKDWIVCDNTSSSTYYGRCYVEYDDFGAGNQVHVAYSSNGGVDWTEGTLPSLSVIGGQPLVQPNGHVVMPIDSGSETSLLSLVSTDGGATWTSTTVTSIAFHGVKGGLRADPLPTAEIDGAGKVYVVWSDCRFRKRCTANDLVMATSADGTTWSSVARIPIDQVTSGTDHFVPGLAVDPGSSGSSAKLGLAYYYYPNASCGSGKGGNACQLSVGYVSSSDGGSSWGAATQLAGPMTLNWLPNTDQGRMVGDYISASFVSGSVYPVFAVASAPTSGGSDCAIATPNCNQPMFTTASGLTAQSQGITSSDQPVPNAAWDHAAPNAAFIR